MSTELLKHGLRLLFIGFNPSPKSAETGWNYAGANNRFYRILFEAGLTDQLLKPSDNRLLFDVYQYGFTNLVQRPTPKASDVTTTEYRAGATRVLETLVQYQPKFACFVGKGVFQQFIRQQQVSWGFQPSVSTCPQTILFVGPGTSGLVRMKLAEQVDMYRVLAKRVRADS